VVSANLVNMQRTGNKYHEPYRRKSVVFQEVLDNVNSLQGVAGSDKVAGGVRVSKIVEDRVSPFPKFNDPGNPNADENGEVWASNVDVFQELVDLSEIERSFDANLTAMRAYRTMLQNTITNIGHG
jgi:flagellar basal-body rod protein FlgC